MRSRVICAVGALTITQQDRYAGGMRRMDHQLNQGKDWFASPNL